MMLRFYNRPGLSSGALSVCKSKIASKCDDISVKNLETELCIYVQFQDDAQEISDGDKEKLKWILSTPFQEENFNEGSFLPKNLESSQLLIEIGPRLNFSTAFSTNAVSICHGIGLTSVWRIEYTTRYLIHFAGINDGRGDNPVKVSKQMEDNIVSVLHDKMTQCRYLTPISSFKLNAKPESVYEVDILNDGRGALEKANVAMGLAFDSWDLDYYTDMFQNKIKRNPTNVECFDLAQSNSEHSRHWFFKGKMVVDGKENEESLFKMVMSTQDASNQNNVIKFSDNSSAISGYDVKLLLPENPAKVCAFKEKEEKRHIIFTAETHNFPTAVAPFPGATTGTGGRIRDVQAAGRGAHVVAGTAGYCFGNLNIPGYCQPWEDKSFEYPSNFASPLEIAIEASNGASDYGNKFGEPVLTGFARSFGLRLEGGKRREWVKPIMFSGGMGSLSEKHVNKMQPEKGMEVVKVGGPVYRIGVGGGSASSIEVQGDNQAELDFGAVQRGDAEMEQKLNRVIRGCIEMGEDNPICSIHDQGAGGNGNVLKEICEPAGALIKAGRFDLGDPTLNLLEIWGAEYQESNALLIQPKDTCTLQKLGRREKCPINLVGHITGTGKIQFEDDLVKPSDVEPAAKKLKKDLPYPVDLELEHVLASMPRKVFHLSRTKRDCPGSAKDVELPNDLSIQLALDRVLRLPSVASKRYLTNKVDRSVTGLVAQQQCVGPLHTPLADVAVTALSHFSTVGSATAIGEQPIKGLVSAESGAKMAVGEALTNLVFAKITDIKDIKCSGNWMWPGKRGVEGAELFDTCTAMCGIMKKLGIAVDGGKDSLSMSARVDTELVNAPGALVVSAYVGCPDITLTVTPDLKCPSGRGCLLYVAMGGNKECRLGGSALAQCFMQLGSVAPVMDDPDTFVKAFNTTQDLIQNKVLESGHDVSDGGLITCLLEMAFAGNCGLQIDIPTSMSENTIAVLFAEELGIVLEVAESHVKDVISAYEQSGVPCFAIGNSIGNMGPEAQIKMTHAGKEVLSSPMVDLRDTWEETSFRLENLQTNPECARQEAEILKCRTAPSYKLSFEMCESHCAGNFPMISDNAPSVAVIREEGSNGDREMVAAFHMAGFKVWDINMHDLCTGQVTLDRFRGIAFVGGFSYADVCGSAKGWAATLKFNESVSAQFDDFFARKDTFSLGVCNGCQLMALLGWVAPDSASEETEKQQGVHLGHNLSDRFESRFVAVRIEQSPSIMLQGMNESVLGIWLAHGEGRMVFKNSGIQDDVLKHNLIPLKYVDDCGKPTTVYPLNPNGSPEGIAALCSKDGRHLAMMPHAERSILSWQWPWMPQAWKKKEWYASPWLMMFQNAYDWCQSTAKAGQ